MGCSGVTWLLRFHLMTLVMKTPFSKCHILNSTDSSQWHFNLLNQSANFRNWQPFKLTVDLNDPLIKTFWIWINNRKSSYNPLKQNLVLSPFLIGKYLYKQKIALSFKVISPYETQFNVLINLITFLYSLYLPSFFETDSFKENEIIPTFLFGIKSTMVQPL